MLDILCDGVKLADTFQMVCSLQNIGLKVCSCQTMIPIPFSDKVDNKSENQKKELMVLTFRITTKPKNVLILKIQNFSSILDQTSPKNNR